MATTYHIRSNSLPSKPNPIALQFDEQFSRLRSSESASTSSSSIIQKLNGFQDLYDSLEKRLQLPLIQQALSQDENRKMVEELLDGSLRLLDVCNIAKDALLRTKENLHEIQSILRRKKGDFSIEVKKYLASRKSLKKSFQKVLKSFKATDDKHKTNNEALAMLKEAEAATVSVFDSLLSFISLSNVQSKPCSKWSLVSKLVNQKRVACEGATADANEFSRVDAAMHLLAENKSDKTVKTEDVQSLEICIQDLEGGLECLFRSLIKIRVAVLNILS